VATASILTIGNELVSGDIANTNGSWLATRLAPLGVETRLVAAIPDEIETIAEFIRREGQFLVRDVGSLNGTYVDRDRIEEAVLKDGDEVQIGKYRLVFHPSRRTA
jgi:sulfur carrier protein ThiS